MPPLASIALPAALTWMQSPVTLTLRQELQAIMDRPEPSPEAHRRDLIQNVIHRQYKQLKIQAPVPEYSQQVIDAITSAYRLYFTRGMPFLICPERNFTWKRHIVEMVARRSLARYERQHPGPGQRLKLITPLPRKEVDRLYLLLSRGISI